MLRNLIAFCLSRRPLVLISFAAFLALGYADQHFPVSERLANEVLSIPVHPSLTDDEVDVVIAAVNGVAAELGPIPAAAHA